MKFDPISFAKGTAGAIVGASIGGNTGDDYEAVPSLIGAGIGAAAASKLNLELPSGISKPIKNGLDTSSGTASFVKDRSSYMEDISTHLETFRTQNMSVEATSNLAFDPKNAMGTVNDTNYKAALRYFESASNTEIKEALHMMREGNEALVKLDPNKLNSAATGSQYSPLYAFTNKDAPLAEKQEVLGKYLQNLDEKNVYGGSSGVELEENRAQRVRELTPLLDRIEGNITYRDGVLLSDLDGEKLALPLTMHLQDGETLGHISNNNVYTSHKFNIMGSVIATGAGGTEESSAVIAKNMGLKEGTEAFTNVQKMLLAKEGITREAAVGVLASMPTMTNKALLDSIDTLSESKQWDEEATSKYVRSQVATRNGTPLNEGDVRSATYTQTQAELIDMKKTIKYKNTPEKKDVDFNADFKDTALRDVKSTTDAKDKGHGVESHNIRREMKFLGEDRVTGVKADHNLLFTPTDNTKGGLFNLNSPNSRNAGTVTNRGLKARRLEIGDSRGHLETANTFKTDLLEKLIAKFGGEKQFGSAVVLNTALFDTDLVSEAFSEFAGANIALADGYAIGRKESFAAFQHTGLKTVKIQANTDGEITLRNPYMRQLLNGETTISELKPIANTAPSFKPIRTATLVENNLSFANAHNFIGGLIDPSDYSGIADVVEPKHRKGLMKYLSQIDRNNRRATANLTTDPAILRDERRRDLKHGVQEYFEKRTQAKVGQTTHHGQTIGNEANKKLAQAKREFIHTGNTEEYEAKVRAVGEELQVQKRNIRDANRAIYPKGGSVIGHGANKEAQALSNSYNNYELKDIVLRQQSSGAPSILEAIYEGSTNIGDNHVVKGYSVNYKDQMVLVDAVTFTGIKRLGEDLTSGVVKYEPKTKQFSILNEQTNAYDNVHKDWLKDNYFEFRNKYGGYSVDEADVISDLKGAGYKHNDNIIKTIKGEVEDSESNVAKRIRDTIQSFDIDERKVGGSVSAGLLDFTYATSNEKPSIATLAESSIKAHEAVDYLDVYDKEHIERLSPYLPSNYQDYIDAGDEDVLLTRVKENIDLADDKLAHHFTTAEGLHELQTDSVKRKEIAQIFINNAQVRGATLNDNNHLNITALNRKAETETGAGTFEKNMSWNAQTQLLANGYTQDEISHFAAFNRGAVNDATALTGMQSKHQTLLQKYFEENSSVMKNVMGASPEDRRKLLEDAFGYKTKDSVDFYDLHYRPETGIKSIPIIYDESRGFDGYTDNTTGTKRTKGINQIMMNIVDTDIKLRNATEASDILSLQSSLESLHNTLEAYVKPILGGSTGVIKSAMTRTGENSILATVGAVNGDMTGFLARQETSGKGGSFAAVSYHGALDRLELAGVELKPEERMQFLQGQGKYLQSIDGSSNLKRVMINDTTPLFSVVNREPSQGPMSARLTEYMLDTSIYDSEGARASLFIKSEDPIYKFLQFGDYDFDTMTEFFGDSRKMKQKDMDGLLQKGRALSKDYRELYDFAKALGVKNNKSDKMDSLFDILEKNPNIKTYDEWHGAYLNQVYDDTTKAGLRKTISPKVTMLASQLNNSLMESVGDLSTKEVQAGRVLTHYFIENLLKAQHSEQSGTAETVAEKLSNLRQNDKSKYIVELNQGLTAQLKNLDPASEDYALGQRAIKAIVTAEDTFLDTSKPINPMEISGAIYDKRLGDALGIAEDVLVGNNQATSVHKTSAIDTELAETVKVGYDRFKKTAKQLFNNNKKVIGLTAAGLAGTAIAFRSNPDEAYQQKATADVGRQSLTPNKQQSDPVEGLSSERPTEYVTPHRDARKAISIEGRYTDDHSNLRNSAQRSLFGDSIDSAQIEYRE